MRHANPSILALDLGTTTGWALLAQGRIVSGSYDMRPRTGETIGVRFIKFRKMFLSNFHDVHEVYFEEVMRHEGTHAAHVYGGLWAIMCAFCEENAIPYRGVAVAQVKKHVTGKGNANKAMMISAMERRGFVPADDNEADALAILSFARHQRGAE